MNPRIDPAFIAHVVRQVIARLQNNPTGQTSTNPNSTAASISDNVVTAQTIEDLSGTPTEVFLTPSAVVTPAAIDTAKLRGIRINRTIEVPPAQRPSTAPTTSQQRIIDEAQPLRAQALQQQLARRGIAESVSHRIILSDTPAAELHRCISHNDCRAAMVTTVNDVDRFHRELQPNVWVFDMGRMNLITAVNAAARIAQIGN